MTDINNFTYANQPKGKPTTSNLVQKLRMNVEAARQKRDRVNSQALRIAAHNRNGSSISEYKNGELDSVKRQLWPAKTVHAPILCVFPKISKF